VRPGCRSDLAFVCEITSGLEGEPEEIFALNIEGLGDTFWQWQGASMLGYGGRFIMPVRNGVGG